MKVCSWKAGSIHKGAASRAALLALLLLLGLPQISRATPTLQQTRGPVYIAEIHGIVTSVTIEYLRRALHFAEAANANTLIIQVSSSGGVLHELRPFAGEIASA